MGWPVCNQTEEYEESRLDLADYIAVAIMADRTTSPGRPSMAGIELSSFWSHSVCEFRFNRGAGIMVSNMAAYNPLP